MENIRYGKLDATDEECIAAAKLAGADDFIRRLPEGYDTKLQGNGANLSQGQRQLLAIARAAVADPPVMILDEATSSIDTRTEAIVQRGMDALMQGRTVFVIAHRLSPCATPTPSWCWTTAASSSAARTTTCSNSRAPTISSTPARWNWTKPRAHGVKRASLAERRRGGRPASSLHAPTRKRGSRPLCKTPCKKPSDVL